MQGEKQIIQKLNEALFLELGAINQYWLHARLLESWGYLNLAEHEKKESMDEMNHADCLIKRIIFLEGYPDLQKIAPLKIGRNIKEILEYDLEGELNARKAYQEARALCCEKADYVTMKIFEDLLKDEESHIDFLETHLALLGQLGEEKYAQIQLCKEE